MKQPHRVTARRIQAGNSIPSQVTEGTADNHRKDFIFLIFRKNLKKHKKVTITLQKCVKEQVCKYLYDSDFV